MHLLPYFNVSVPNFWGIIDMSVRGEEGAVVVDRKCGGMHNA